MNRIQATLYSAALVLVATAPGHTATPAGGTLSEATPQVAWSGGPLIPTASADCGGPDNPACDNFALTIEPPDSPFRVTIELVPQTGDDYDLQVWSPSGSLEKSSGNSPGQPERVVLDAPAAGTHTVSAAPFAVTRSYNATAVLELVEENEPPTGGGPQYSIHVAPVSLGDNAGEPTLGVNYESGKVMYIAGLETLRVGFEGCSSPPPAAWEDVSFLTTSLITLDPILWTDQDLGRTVVSQLLTKPGSAMALTDDDGESWIPSQGGGINSGVDHQSVGGGPLAPPLVSLDPEYPNGVYYCSQDLAMAQCALSLDGGLNFGPAVPIYNATECGGLHGHVKVGLDGAAYVPNKACGGEQGMAVSLDNGLTWTVRQVPGSVAGVWDPSAAPALDPASPGTVYMGMANGDGHPWAAVSHDNGVTWEHLQDVGTAHGIQNIAFPAIVAGDAERAAFAFLGTTTAGNASGDDPNFPAVWHLYVAHTYDGGQTWVTENVTAGDPVQRGTICAGGVGCGTTRNLLDFMDATVDAEGRVLVAFADGCLGGCVNAPPNSFAEKATIARQVTGKRLLAEHDVAGAPEAPAVSATLQADGDVLVSWSYPDDHLSPISQFLVFRRTASGNYGVLAELPATSRSFEDTTVVAGESYFYQVTAVNAEGESQACGEASPTEEEPEPQGSRCVLPGLQIASDAEGDVNTGGSDGHDILALFAAEPLFEDGSQKLVLTMKVRDLASVPVNSTWRMEFVAPDGETYFVAADSSDPTGVTCRYGFLDGNIYTSQGPADGCEVSQAEGTFTITIATSKVGGIGAGTAIAVQGTAQLLVGAAGTGLLATIDTAGPGGYTLAGNDACANQGPVAVDDNAETAFETAVTVDVLANDSDPDGGPLTVTGAGPATDGTVAVDAGSAVTYTPNAGFAGVDSFPYTISDPAGATASATVTVTVEQGEGNQPPTAVDDTANTFENKPVRVEALANDSDPDGDAISIVALGAAEHGEVVAKRNGKIFYKPDKGFTGEDGFTYTIADSQGHEATASVRVTVDER